MPETELEKIAKNYGHLQCYKPFTFYNKHFKQQKHLTLFKCRDYTNLISQISVNTTSIGCWTAAFTYKAGSYPTRSDTLMYEFETARTGKLV